MFNFCFCGVLFFISIAFVHLCFSSLFYFIQVYHPLARALFNYAFFSCWQEIDEEAKMDCVVNIKKALEASEIPPEILHALLNLAEFMEHNFHPLPYPITHKILGDLAEKNHAYAKALHCKEIEFQHDPTRCIEALISINNQLGLPEAAGGILTYAQQQQGMELKESWYFSFFFMCSEPFVWPSVYFVHITFYLVFFLFPFSFFPFFPGMKNCINGKKRWQRMNKNKKKTPIISS